jgi:hypothetical protein
MAALRRLALSVFPAARSSAHQFNSWIVHVNHWFVRGSFHAYDCFHARNPVPQAAGC